MSNRPTDLSSDAPEPSMSPSGAELSDGELNQVAGGTSTSSTNLVLKMKPVGTGNVIMKDGANNVTLENY